MKPALCVLLMLASVTGGSQMIGERNVHGSPGSSSISRSLWDFSWKVTRHIEDDGNMVMSPLSMAFLLNLFLLASSGETHRQLRTALSYPAGLSDDMVHRQSNIQLQALNRYSEGRINVANALFLNPSLSLKSSYKQNVQRFYQAEIEPLPLNGAAARDLINEWVSRHTNGLIQNMINEPIRPGTPLVAANAVVFNSSWQVQFDPQRTKVADFHVSQRETMKAHMMTSTAFFLYGHFDDFQVVCLPYTGQSHSMCVFLPHQAGRQFVVDMENYLSSNMEHVLNSLHATKVVVHLPRFEIGTRIDLRNILSKMGVQELFDVRADLSGMTDGTVFISDIIHQAVIEVNERGTEAAAATVAFSMRSGFSPPQFMADKPFTYAIIDSVTLVPLFTGRVERPIAVSREEGSRLRSPPPLSPEPMKYRVHSPFFGTEP